MIIMTYLEGELYVTNYAALERKVSDIFKVGENFMIEGIQYTVSLSGKPRPHNGKGECKTDCYIFASSENNEENIELKISCKLPTNEFQENKITAARAEELLGPNWSNIIKDSSEGILSRFKEQELIHYNGRGRTKEGLIILGWKCEIASKKRNLSALLKMSHQDIRDYIYKGMNQTESKCNARIRLNDDSAELQTPILNSGVANCMLVCNTNDLTDIQSVIDRLQDIDTYEIVDHYLIYTANSYRIQSGKTDGNRSLAVRVEWSADVRGLTLIPKIRVDYPLSPTSKSTPMKNIADQSLNILGTKYRQIFLKKV